MTPADAKRLQDAFRRENRSLLRYALDAAPYTPAADRDLLGAVRRVAEEEAAVVAALGDFLDARQVSRPHLGAFPVTYTDLNFVAVRFLLAKLVTAQTEAVAAREADATAAADAGARVELGRLVDVGRRHGRELGALGK